MKATEFRSCDRFQVAAKDFRWPQQASSGCDRLQRFTTDLRCLRKTSGGCDELHSVASTFRKEQLTLGGCISLHEEDVCVGSTGGGVRGGGGVGRSDEC